MALSRSSLFSALSGNLPGVEVAMSKSGMVIKQRKATRKMNSKAEQAALRSFTRWNRKWAALSADQVKAFNAYAAAHPVTDRLGASKYVSGRNLFMRLRMPLSDDYPEFDETMPPAETTMPIWFISGELWHKGPYILRFYTHETAKEDAVISLWVARWQSGTTTHKPQTWIPVPPSDYWPLTTDWYDLFIEAGIGLQAGERIAIKSVVRMPNKWPSPPYISWHTVLPAMSGWYKCNDFFSNAVVADMLEENDAEQRSGGIPDDVDLHTVPGHIGTALYQDGVDDDIIIPTGAYLAALGEGTDFTLCFWWKADEPDPATAKHFVSNYAAAGVGLAFATKSDEYSTTIRAKKGAVTVEEKKVWTTPVDTDWHFFAIARKDTAVKMFFDDSETHEIDAANFDGAVAEVGVDLAIGDQAGTARWSPGAIDDFRIYTTRLSDTAISELAAM